MPLLKKQSFLSKAESTGEREENHWNDWNRVGLLWQQPL
jgi:hypothetical protein